MQRKKINNKKVLLATNSSVVGAEALLHGLSLCRRMGGSLKVLHLIKSENAEKATRSFKEVMTKLNLAEHVGYSQLPWENDFTQETINYAKKRRNLLCVILCPSTDDDTGKGKNRKKFHEATQQLSCPVVLYTDSLVYL